MTTTKMIKMCVQARVDILRFTPRPPCERAFPRAITGSSRESTGAGLSTHHFLHRCIVGMHRTREMHWKQLVTLQRRCRRCTRIVPAVN